MEDEQIIELYWNRQESAISETAEKYGVFCRKIAFNILNSREDTVECENDTYMAVWNKLPPERPIKLPAFIGRITRNLALNRYDYNRAEKRDNKMTVMLEELEECIPSTSSVEGAFDAKETVRLINEFLKKQNQRSRVMFVRRYWYGDSIEDIAKEMELGISNVKTSLFRTRKQLKEHLQKGGVVL